MLFIVVMSHFKNNMLPLSIAMLTFAVCLSTNKQRNFKIQLIKFSLTERR
jgi:hypothetical protein